MPKKVKPSEIVPFSTGPGYMTREAHKAMSRHLAAALVPQGIAFKQYYYLRSLFEQDGISQTVLSDRVGTDRATVTRVLDTMERDGFIVRKADPSDRRKTKIFLTAYAKSKRAKLLRTIERMNEKSLAGIPKADIAHFYRIIGHIIANNAGPKNLAANDPPSA